MLKFEVVHPECGGVVQGRTCTKCQYKEPLLQFIGWTKYQFRLGATSETRYHLLPRKRWQKWVLVGVLLVLAGIVVWVF